MVNQSKKNDVRTWEKWKNSGALGSLSGKDFGEAYAFFDSDVSRKELEYSLPDIKKYTHSPKGLQILVKEGVSGTQFDERLLEQLEYPFDYRIMSHERAIEASEELRPLSSMKYSLIASYKRASNREVAEELITVLDNIHRLYNKDQGLFRCGIVYQAEDGEYELI